MWSTITEAIYRAYSGRYSRSCNWRNPKKDWANSKSLNSFHAKLICADRVIKQSKHYVVHSSWFPCSVNMGRYLETNLAFCNAPERPHCWRHPSEELHRPPSVLAQQIKLPYGSVFNSNSAIHSSRVSCWPEKTVTVLWRGGWQPPNMKLLLGSTRLVPYARNFEVPKKNSGVCELCWVWIRRLGLSSADAVYSRLQEVRLFSLDNLGGAVALLIANLRPSETCFKRLYIPFQYYRNPFRPPNGMVIV